MTSESQLDAALDDKFTLVGGGSSFTSPFTTSSGYTFAENTDLLKSMTVNAAGDRYHYMESEGWMNTDRTIWRTVNAFLDNPVDAAVTKEWDDYNDETGLRPDSISVTLYRKDSNGNVDSVLVRTLTEENGWYYSTADDENVTLDKYDAYGKAYSYYWEEAAASMPEGYTQTAEKTYYDENDQVWVTEFTNSLTVTVPVSVEKIWADDDDAQGIRPSAIYMRLYADGVWVDVNGSAVTSATTADTAVVLNAGNNWKVTLSGLPKYNSSGKEITYKFVELTYSTELIISGVKVTPAESVFTWYTGSKTTGYLASYSYSGNATTVTNTHTAGGEVTVYKKVLASDIDWTSGEPSFTFTLTAADGTETAKTITFTEDFVKANTDADGYVTGSATYTNLSYGTYTLEETEMPDGWQFVSLAGENGTVSGEKVKFTISSTNVKETFTAAFTDEYVLEGGITVYKKVLASDISWEDGEPSFTFTLTAPGGTKATKTVTITKLYADANTDSSGYVTIRAEFPDLEYGTYTLEEMKMPEDWEFVSLTCTDGTVSGKKATFTISKANAEMAVEATYVNQYNKPGALPMGGSASPINGIKRMQDSVLKHSNAEVESKA